MMPSMLSGSVRKTNKGKGKFDRDIVHLLHSYSSPKSIPRKDTRANLAGDGLIGKVKTVI